MSVNPDMSATMGVADEFVDLEHQVIRQKLTVGGGEDLGLSPGEAGAEFDPGERQLDREEVAQLVAYRRYAYAAFEQNGQATDDTGVAIIDASVGINGDLFREVTTDSIPEAGIEIDEGGEIGLLDSYTMYTAPPISPSSNASPGFSTVTEQWYNFYDWPTGGPIVDSFDTITCGFGSTNFNNTFNATFELRYDFWWDVAEQGRSTNPFGRPSTR